jgi:hypothetical protein
VKRIFKRAEIGTEFDKPKKFYIKDSPLFLKLITDIEKNIIFKNDLIKISDMTIICKPNSKLEKYIQTQLENYASELQKLD